MGDLIILPPLPEDDIEHDGYGKLYKYGHSDAQLRAHAAAVTAAKDAEIAALRAESAQLREYLDTARRRASALGDEVAELREALEGLDEAYCRAGAPLTREQRTEDRKRLIAARAALAARKGTT